MINEGIIQAAGAAFLIGAIYGMGIAYLWLADWRAHCSRCRRAREG